MQFKYKLTKSPFGWIPFIDVILKNKDDGKATGYKAMLDSGAFGNVIHSDVAGVLGIDLNKIPKQPLFSGVEQSNRMMEGWPYVITMMVKSKGKSHQFEVPVIFSDEINNNAYALLGRMGFFDQFDNIIFDYKNKFVSLNKDS